MVRVDANRFMQIMSNLLSNAAKFSPANSTVELKVSKQKGYLRVSVKDQGKGIAHEFRHLIFEKFSQADSTDARHSAGTGLGLAICKQLVENMGGKIGFTTSIGQGSCFYFDLPEVQAGGQID